MLFRFFNTYLELVSYLLCLIAVLVYYRKAKAPISSLLYTYYILITILIIIACFNLFAKSNIWAYDISALLSSLCIGAFFYKLYISPFKRKVVIGCTIVYLLYVVYRNFTVEGLRLFDSAGYSILSASIALYIFMYFQQVLKNVTEKSILSQFSFWLASSYLLYYVGSFIIFLSYYYLTSKIINTLTPAERDLLMSLWGIHNVLLFMSALTLLTGSLWLTYRTKSS